MSIKNKIKTVLTRITTMTLALTMCVTPLTPITVNANSGSGGYLTGTGSGQDANNGNASSNGKIGWGETVGYRMYIVDQNFNCVSNMYDFINGFNTNGKHPIIHQSTAPMGRPYNESAPKGYGLYTLQQLQQRCEATSLPPVPYTYSKGYGEEFYLWFFSRSDGSGIDDLVGSGTPTGDRDTDGDGLKVLKHLIKIV